MRTNVMEGSDIRSACLTKGTVKRKAVNAVCALLLAGNLGGAVFAQSYEQKTYLGMGLGLDYGGIGGKIEYLPVKHFGVFGGLGYNLVSAGWNIGATCKILPDKRFSPNLMLFYGYNAIQKIKNAPEYDATSYGVTIGGNIDIVLGQNGNKLSLGLFVPFRSGSFNDKHAAAKADPNVSFYNKLTPVAFSVGFNFPL